MTREDYVKLCYDFYQKTDILFVFVDHDWDECTTIDPVDLPRISWEQFEYKTELKPKPETVPWEYADYLREMPTHLLKIGGTSVYVIKSFSDLGIYINGDGMSHLEFIEVPEKYTLPNGDPLTKEKV